MTVEENTKRLEKLMEEANVNFAQRVEFRSDPVRAVALLDHALKRRAVKSPAAYALSRFRRGDWPERRGRDRTRPALAYELAHRMIQGGGWDDGYGVEYMNADLEALYARRGERLTDGDRERLLLAWQLEYARRYPPEQ